MNDKQKRDIERTVSQPPTEDTVRTLMVAIREADDSAGGKSLPGNLRSYCNWTVHMELTKNQQTEPFFKVVDSFIQHLKDNPDKPFQNAPAMESLYFMNDLRQSLREFLKANGFDSTITDTDNTWKEFLKAYFALVHERKMIYSRADLVHVQEIALTTASPSTGGIHFMDSSGKPITMDFSMKLEVKKKDGATTNISLPDWKTF